MDDSYWTSFGLELTLLAFIVSLVFLMRYRHVTYQRRNKKQIDEMFHNVMAQHGIENVEIRQDRTTLGSRRKAGKRPFDVHRILHNPPNLWFVYIHVEDASPVLMPISEQRAMTSVTGMGVE